MAQLSNKIQIPVKTKIALSVNFLVGLIVGALLVRIVSCPIIYGINGNCGLSPFTGIALFFAYGLLLSLGLFLLLYIVGFFYAKNTVWGYGIFIAAGSFSSLMFFVVGFGMVSHLLIISLLAAIIFSFILLLIDHKNYRAALEMAKSKNKI